MKELGTTSGVRQGVRSGKVQRVKEKHQTRHRLSSPPPVHTTPVLLLTPLLSAPSGKAFYITKICKNTLKDHYNSKLVPITTFNIWDLTPDIHLEYAKGAEFVVQMTWEGTAGSSKRYQETDNHIIRIVDYVPKIKFGGTRSPLFRQQWIAPLGVASPSHPHQCKATSQPTNQSATRMLITSTSQSLLKSRHRIAPFIRKPKIIQYK